MGLTDETARPRQGLGRVILNSDVRECHASGPENGTIGHCQVQLPEAFLNIYICLQLQVPRDDSHTPP